MGLPLRRRESDIVRLDDQFPQLDRIRQGLLSIFDSPAWSSMDPMRWPAMPEDQHLALADLVEREDEFELSVELPGIDREAIDIEAEGRRIIVTAQRDEQERDGVLRHRTRVVGQIRHEALLPSDVNEEAIEATLDKGVLRLRLPKAENAKRHHIDIR